MSKIPFSKIIWLIVLIVGIGLIAFSFFARDVKAPEPTSSSLVLPQPAKSPLAQPTTSPSSQKTSNQSKIAACQLSGSIHFINDNLYETKGAKIVYQNIDDTIRQIYWTSNPNDGALIVGPNLFEQLVIPNGEREVGVTLIKNTNVKLYILTAAVTYGIPISPGVEKVETANCAETITVALP